MIRYFVVVVVVVVGGGGGGGKEGGLGRAVFPNLNVIQSNQSKYIRQACENLVTQGRK